MQDTCLLAAFGDEIVRHVRMGGQGLDFRTLLHKIGPDHTKYEFWEALRYHLNRDMLTWRDSTSQAIRLTFDKAQKPKNTDGWYMYERRGNYGGVTRFYIPPIPLVDVRRALLKPAKATEHTLATATKQVIVAYPELNVFDKEEVIVQIVAPALFSRHQRQTITA